jgi:hypothetical protein
VLGGFLGDPFEAGTKQCNNLIAEGGVQNLVEG